MTKIYILINHEPTIEQLIELEKTYGNYEIIQPEPRIKQFWANIDPELNSLERSNKADEIIEDIVNKKSDIVWIQGESIMVYLVVRKLEEKDILAFASTTKRQVVEVKKEDGTVVKQSMFKHCRFVHYF